MVVFVAVFVAFVVAVVGVQGKGRRQVGHVDDVLFHHWMHSTQKECPHDKVVGGHKIS